MSPNLTAYLKVSWEVLPYDLSNQTTVPDYRFFELFKLKHVDLAQISSIQPTLNPNTYLKVSNGLPPGEYCHVTYQIKPLYLLVTFLAL